MDSSLDRALLAEMVAWEAAGLRRVPRGGAPCAAGEFASNDTLSLSRHPEVVAAARAALDAHGAGGRASRLLGGGSPPDAEAEAAAADWLGAEAALLFPTGFAGNLGVVTALAGRGDAIVSDAANHASLIDAARLSRARVLVHPHGDVQAAGRQLAAASGARRRLLLTEGVFSMDGDAAPLVELAALCARHDAWLVVDEAHAAGLVGPRGAGAWAAVRDPLPAEHAERLAARLLTGGKALGVAGGFVVGSRALREHLVNRARSFVFTTAVPPAVSGGLVAAIRLARAADAERARVRAAARRVARALGAPEPAAAIVPVHVGDGPRALAVSERLAARGLDVRAVRFPSVPAGTERLRVVCHAHNDEAHVDALIATLREALAADGASTRPVRAPRDASAPTCAAPRVLAVVGTDTGVGKTVVSALLCRAAVRARPGAPVTYWKPVQTGDESDGEEVARLLGGAGGAAGAVRIEAPAHAFPLPASPDQAAAAAGARVDVPALDRRLARLAAGATGDATGGATGGLLVVEPVGGLLVPYDEATSQADLLAAHQPGIVLVARSGLGTLNHTLLTLEALAARGLTPCALVLVGPPHAANRATLARRSGIEAVFELPPMSPLDGAALDRWLDGASQGAALGAWIAARLPAAPAAAPAGAPRTTAAAP